MEVVESAGSIYIVFHTHTLFNSRHSKMPNMLAPRWQTSSPSTPEWYALRIQAKESPWWWCLIDVQVRNPYPRSTQVFLWVRVPAAPS